jgi:hypothetical protein
MENKKYRVIFKSWHLDSSCMASSPRYAMNDSNPDTNRDLKITL